MKRWLAWTRWGRRGRGPAAEASLCDDGPSRLTLAGLPRHHHTLLTLTSTTDTHLISQGTRIVRWSLAYIDSKDARLPKHTQHDASLITASPPRTRYRQGPQQSTMNWLKKEDSGLGPSPTSLMRNISSPSKKYRAKPLTKEDVTSNESLFYWRRQYEDMIHYLRESGVTPEEADDDEVSG